MKLATINKLKEKLEEHGIKTGIPKNDVHRLINILIRKYERIRHVNKRNITAEVILQLHDIDHDIILLILEAIDYGDIDNIK